MFFVCFIFTYFWQIYKPLGSKSVDPHIFADPDPWSQKVADPDPKNCKERLKPPIVNISRNELCLVSRFSAVDS